MISINFMTLFGKIDKTLKGIANPTLIMFDNLNILLNSFESYNVALDHLEVLNDILELA